MAAPVGRGRVGATVRLGVLLPFLALVEIVASRGGRRRGAKRPERVGPGAFGPGPPSFVWLAVGGPGGPPHGRQTPPPPVTAPSILRPRATAVRPTDACWPGGSRIPQGCPPGRRRFAGPEGPQNQSRSGGQGPPLLLCARCARPPPRPKRWNFWPAIRSIRQPFPHQNQPTKRAGRSR